MQWKLFFQRKRLASLLTRWSGASPTHRQISEICLSPASSTLLLPIPAKHPLTICMLRLRWKTAAFSHLSFAESLSIFSSNRFPACTCQICICPAHCTGQGTHGCTHPSPTHQTRTCILTAVLFFLLLDCRVFCFFDTSIIIFFIFIFFFIFNIFLFG